MSQAKQIEPFFSDETLEDLSPAGEFPILSSSYLPSIGQPTFKELSNMVTRPFNLDWHQTESDGFDPYNKDML